MAKEKISENIASVVEILLNQRGKREFLGEFLQDCNFAKKRKTVEFITHLMNKGGLDEMPHDWQQDLVNWAKKLMAREAWISPAIKKAHEAEKINEGRRWFMVKAGLGAMGASTVASTLVKGHRIAGSLETLQVGAGASLIIHVEGQVRACENLFREKLPLWLKEQHGIDFKFPAQPQASKNLR